MNNYDEISAKTLSKEFHGDDVTDQDLIQLATGLNQWGDLADKIKRTLYYGAGLKLTDMGVPIGELSKEKQHLLHAAFGKVTESIELFLPIVAHVLGEDLDEVNALEELGDDEWYNALFRRTLGVTSDDVQRANIAKLQGKGHLEGRYADGFDAEEALNRDTDQEMQALQDANE